MQIVGSVGNLKYKQHSHCITLLKLNKSISKVKAGAYASLVESGGYNLDG